MHSYLRHLANFARIVEAGSMKAAADLLGAAPSGLSDSVRILEAKCAKPLLVRHRAGVTPTLAGEQLYEKASGIVDLLEAALGAEGEDALSGPCRLSVPSEVANTCLGPVVRALGAAHPGLEISVFAEDEVLDHARFARDYFLRFASQPKDHPGLSTIWQAEVHAILVAGTGLVSQEQAQDAAYLATLPGIRRGASKAEMAYGLRGPDERLAFQRVIHASQPATGLAFAEENLGVIGCLDICAAQGIGRGGLRQVMAGRFSRKVTARLMTPHLRRRHLDDVMSAAMAHLLS